MMTGSLRHLSPPRSIPLGPSETKDGWCHHRGQSSRIVQESAISMALLSCKRVAKSASLFRDWTTGAKIVKTRAPQDVMNHFNKLYQLEEMPRALVQVRIPCLHIYHS